MAGVTGGGGGPVGLVAPSRQRTRPSAASSTGPSPKARRARTSRRCSPTPRPSSSSCTTTTRSSWRKRAQSGLADQTAPLRCLLNHAAANPDDWAAIFWTVHCHRCDTDDGLKENAWKKSKKPVSLQLLPEQIKFLIGRVNNEEGVELEAKGPVNRAVLDTGKAARCAMDWCITQEEAGEDVSWIFGGDVGLLQASL